MKNKNFFFLEYKFYDGFFQKGLFCILCASLLCKDRNFPVVIFSADWSQCFCFPDNALGRKELLLSWYRDLFLLTASEFAKITVCFSPNEDGTHERAGSNLRYFEKLLEKEREEKEKEKSVNKTLTTTEAMMQSGAYERPLDYLPERDIYEALCRGEGVKMVRDKNFLTMLPLHKGGQA